MISITLACKYLYKYTFDSFWTEKVNKWVWTVIKHQEYLHIPTVWLLKLKSCNKFITILGMLDTIKRMIMAAITVDMSLDTTVVELDRPFRRFFILRTCKITIGIS